MIMVFPGTPAGPTTPANTHIYTVLNWTELKARVPTAPR